MIISYDISEHQYNYNSSMLLSLVLNTDEPLPNDLKRFVACLFNGNISEAHKIIKNVSDKKIKETMEWKKRNNEL